MLTPAQTDIIKATVPILEAGGEALTTHFYKLMFREYPEVQPLFNQAHQANGDQPRALANGVLMYAKHIDRLGELGDLVGQIIHKHVSLQILPEHYPIVGTCLLQAIREVLGPDVATDAVIEAWGVAYGQLADILIHAEEQIYAANAAANGGWRGARRFKVVEKTVESDEITSFVFAPVDGGKVLDFLPGQYIGLRLLLDGEEHRRNYSLSALANGATYRISVKREVGGKVSGYLHNEATVGTELELFPPAGHFTLRESDRPLVLITGGVGITPALTMLEAAKTTGRPVHFIHFARHGAAHAFRDHVDALAQTHDNIRHFVCYSEPRSEDQADATGFCAAELLRQWMPETSDVDAYFLGPKPFMATVKRQLRELGVPAAQTFYEFFGPAASLDEAH